MPRGRRRKYQDDSLTDEEYRRKYQQEYFLQDPSKLMKYSIQQEIRKKKNAILRAEQKIIILRREIEVLEAEFPTEVGGIQVNHEPRVESFN
jgi:hypothetical protein